MSEVINDKKVFSLLEVTLSIKKTIQERYQRSFWVKAEMNKLNHYSYSGHCYPELVEKIDGKVVAQMKTNLWRDDYLRINANFLNTLKEPLKDGINILFNATVNFDPVHGLSLRIIDIDPVFSLGELEREKLETIEKLRREGVFHSNKDLSMPLLPQRIAVISVETSKGYADFLKIISNNTWGYRFFCFLFPALLQGDRSVDSILYQLRRIRKVKHHFDVVAIVRGGGGDVGLSSYNHYLLAKEICQFPIPVLTGIGHSTNETVAEMVSFRNAITPTELADFLIQAFHNFSVPLQQMQETLVSSTTGILADERAGLLSSARLFKSVTNQLLIHNRHEIKALARSASQHLTYYFQNKSQLWIDYKNRVLKSTISFQKNKVIELANVEKSINLMDPINIIRRGFSITLKDGKAIKSLSDIKPGDKTTTITLDGTIISEVVSTKRNETT
ncbi:MAG TPA: exodeoxyribonuclease VII large subunit [Chryseolinea sp.]